ncbi:DUF916 and DUF3324 domain-containing protein [Enterococcus sp. AZ177]|uniref:DUF916 and DUF3324 domain-containing protein n=1 Tax=unclassified Enterococcus TaxID=2608891 RepID=UPI003D2FA24D
MKKQKIKWLIALIYIMFGYVTMPVQATAQKDKNASEGGFTYKAIYPENQHNDVGYFDLRMKPGQKQTVIMQMSNSSNKELVMEVRLNSTKTNSNGVLEYGSSSLAKDKSLKYEFSDIVKGPDTVTIPAKGTLDYTMEIKMPEATFDGVISGGIEIQEKESEEAQKSEKGMVINKYAYVVGMLLTETDKQIKPNLKFNKVYPELKNYRNAIFINFSNVESAFIDEMTIDVQIMRKSSDEVVYDTKQSRMRMAPNSMIDFPVSLNGEKMVAGDYRARVVVTADGEKWSWEEPFIITDEEADKFNQEDVSLLQENGINWVMIILIVSGVFLSIVAIFFVVKKLSNKPSKKKKGKRKQSKKKRTI